MKKLIVAAMLIATPVSAQQTITPQQGQSISKIALDFLARTDLKGSEADAMFQVKLMLNAIVSGSLIITEPPKPATPPTEPAKK